MIIRGCCCCLFTAQHQNKEHGIKSLLRFWFPFNFVMKLTGCCTRQLCTVSWCTSGAMALRPWCWTPQQTAAQRWELFPACCWRCLALEADSLWLLPSLFCESQWAGVRWRSAFKGSTCTSGEFELAYVQPCHGLCGVAMLHLGSMERWVLCREMCC